MKRFFSLLAVLPLCVCLFSQQKIKDIKKDNRYYWGEGKAASLEMADKYALSDLISQISVSVQSQFKSIVKQTDDLHTEETENIIRTYSHATLNYADRLVEEDKSRTTVVRYILRSQLSELFEMRKSKIEGYFLLGRKAEQQRRVGDALKYYYWSYILLQNYPERDMLTFELMPGKTCSLISYLPDCIHSIFSRLIFSPGLVKQTPSGKIFHWKVLLDSVPVQNFDYTYWDGGGQSTLINTRTGDAVAEIFGAAAHSMENIRLTAELQHRTESKIDEDVFNVLEYAKLPVFPKAEYTIPLAAFKADNDEWKVQQEQPQHGDSLFFYQEIIHRVHQAIEKKNYEAIKGFFTPNGWQDFDRLLAYGNAVLVDKNEDQELVCLKDEIQIRSYPMLFSFRNNSQRFIENVVYAFSGDKISAITFAVSPQTCRDVMQKSQAFGSPEQRYILLRMLEHYKTAYCLGDIPYLDQIFSENALIIVGKQLLKGQSIDRMYVHTDIDYIRLTKNQFLERLKRTFKNNEFVNLKFDETTIRKGKGEIYGIQLSQHYYSSSYSDQGYLFLMVDLKNVDRPCIYVRTWQPEKSPDGSVYGLEMFDVN